MTPRSFSLSVFFPSAFPPSSRSRSTFFPYLLIQSSFLGECYVSPRFFWLSFCCSVRRGSLPVKQSLTRRCLDSGWRHVSPRFHRFLTVFPPLTPALHPSSSISLRLMSTQNGYIRRGQSSFLWAIDDPLLIFENTRPFGTSTPRPHFFLGKLFPLSVSNRLHNLSVPWLVAIV